MLQVDPSNQSGNMSPSNTEFESVVLSWNSCFSKFQSEFQKGIWLVQFHFFLHHVHSEFFLSRFVFIRQEFALWSWYYRSDKKGEDVINFRVVLLAWWRISPWWPTSLLGHNLLRFWSSWKSGAWKTWKKFRRLLLLSKIVFFFIDSFILRIHFALLKKSTLECSLSSVQPRLKKKGLNDI